MKLAEHTTDYFIGKKLINESERDIYVYSFEVLVSDLVYFMIAFLTALISGTLIETLLFFLGFFSIRRFAGGFHAGSYKRCHLLFWLNQVMMVILLRITDFSMISMLILILYAASLFSVFSLAPIANKNKPFTESEAKRFGLLSRVMIILTHIKEILLLLQLYVIGGSLTPMNIANPKNIVKIVLYFFLFFSIYFFMFYNEKTSQHNQIYSYGDTKNTYKVALTSDMNQADMLKTIYPILND